jgi:hypothetical protein
VEIQDVTSARRQTFRNKNSSLGVQFANLTSAKTATMTLSKLLPKIEIQRMVSFQLQAMI